MAWSAPRTWVTAEVVTAAVLNAHVRDNLDETAPAKVTTAGDLVYASGANALTRLAAAGDDHRILKGSATTPSWAGITNFIQFTRDHTTTDFALDGTAQDTAAAAVVNPGWGEFTIFAWAWATVRVGSASFTVQARLDDGTNTGGTVLGTGGASTGSVSLMTAYSDTGYTSSTTYTLEVERTAGSSGTFESGTVVAMAIRTS